jgi:superfamily II DNA or RNA helicase
MDARRIVKITRRGPRLAIHDLTPEIQALLHPELSYSYVRQIRGAEYRRRRISAETLPVECYKVVTDKDGFAKPQMITTAGWLNKINTKLREAGYRVFYKDNTPPSPGGPNVYKPLWQRLNGVTFKWKQEEVLRLITQNPYGRIECPTGYGKSFLIKCLATILPYARFTVTTHSADVITMLYEDLAYQLPSVGLITGSRKILQERVMCVSGKSLHHAPLDSDFLLVDEVQEFATQDYLGRVAKFRRSRNFGFSANSEGDRNDGADFELEGPFGPPLITLQYADAVANECIVQIKFRMLDMHLKHNPCEGLDTPETRNRHGLWRNDTRNAKFAAAVREYPDAQVLCTVDTVEHACALKKHLPEFELVYSPAGLDPEKRDRYTRWGWIPASEPVMTDERRLNLKRAFEQGKLKKAIATTVWNRGVNFTQLSVLARLDARASPVADKQIPGRLSRLDKEKNYGLLIDSADQFDDRFERKADQRRRQYKKLGWEWIHERDAHQGKHTQKELFA